MGPPAGLHSPLEALGMHDNYIVVMHKLASSCGVSLSTLC